MKLQEFCSVKELVDSCAIAFKEPFKHGYYSISSNLFSLAKQAKDDSCHPLVNALELCSKICSMKLNPSSANEPFRAYIEFDGQRSSIADDFTEHELNYIALVVDNISEPIVRARLADLLWLLINPKKVKYARIAIQAYLLLPIDSGSWHSDINYCWERVIRLARQIRDQDALNQVETALITAFRRSYPDSKYMKLWIAELLENTGLHKGSSNEIAHTLFNISAECYGQQQYKESREYIKLAEKLFQYNGSEEEWLKSLCVHADCYEQEGNLRNSGGRGSQLVANSLYESALQFYRRIPVKNRNEYGINEKLEAIKKKIAKAGVGALKEMGVFESPGVDIKEIVSAAREHVSEKGSLERTLLFYTGFVSPSYEALKKESINLTSKFPLSSMFGSTHYSKDGQVIGKTPGMNFTSISEGSNEAGLNRQILQSYQIQIRLSVQAQIIPALNQILSEYRITKHFLESLCHYSPIVPEGREYLFANALWHGFEHDFSISIHLLSPQVEHMVRCMLKDSGTQTSNIDRDGIENENGLSTLLNTPDAEKFLGEDLLFEMKAIFTESIGNNLRNKVAHGLLCDEEASSVGSVYAWWMILKVVVRSLSQSTSEKRNK